MFKAFYLAPSALALVLGTLALTAPVYAEGGVKIGVLTCNVDSGWGFILGSSKDIRCNFAPTRGDNDRYTGTITKLGVDIGYTKGGVIIWQVIAPSSTLRDGALEGSYGGVTASNGDRRGRQRTCRRVRQVDRAATHQHWGNTGLNAAGNLPTT
jgi:hypothetical protein